MQKRSVSDGSVDVIFGTKYIKSCPTELRCVLLFHRNKQKESSSTRDAKSHKFTYTSFLPFVAMRIFFVISSGHRLQGLHVTRNRQHTCSHGSPYTRRTFACAGTVEHQPRGEEVASMMVTCDDFGFFSFLQR